jgi:hypothetical protein
MKRRTILSLILSAGLLFPLSSCFNLDEDVYDTIPADNFGRNDAEVNAIIGPVYNTLKRYFNEYRDVSENSGMMSLKPTRRGGDWWDGGQYREFHFHTWTAQTQQLRNAWNAATQSIASCNLIYKTIEGSPLEETAKARALAEIRGVRAFWMYILCEYFGNVPMSLDFDDTSLPTNRPRQEVFDWLVKEVTEIKDLLRTDVSAASYGKFTKGSAYTLLAKLYLNAEAWGVSTTANAYQEVADACDVVMGMDYILEPNWKDNFAVANNGSKETILAACYSDQDTQYQNGLHFNTLHYLDNIYLGCTFSAWNGLCALPDLAKMFDHADPRYDGSFLHGPMTDPATGEILITAHGRQLIHGDDVTVIPGTERLDGDIQTWGDVEQEDGVRVYKWPYDRKTISAMENDFQIFRLADVYLMKAEALVRMGGDIAEATRLVNAVVERAWGSADHNYTTVDLETIWKERKFELAWECYAHQDDIRFGHFQDARWLKPSTAGKTYLNIFPIPLTAWQTNQQLTQNPGYPSFSAAKFYNSYFVAWLFARKS